MRLSSAQLEAFAVAAQALSFREAARRLYLTQPAITQRIKELESQVGAPLFVRAGRRVTLTEAGQILLAYCRRHAEAEDVVLEEIRAGQRGLSGRFAIAAGSALTRAWLLPTLAPLLREHPGLELAFLVDDQLDATRALMSQSADLALATAPVAGHGIVSQHLGDEEVVLVGSEGYAGQLPVPRLIDFDERDPLTREFLRDHVPTWDLTGATRVYVNDEYGIVDLLRVGTGISAVPRYLVAESLATGQLLDLAPGRTSPRPVYLAYIHSGLPSRRMQVIAARIRASAADFLAGCSPFL